MSDLSVSRYAPCYRLNPSTGKGEFGTYNFSKLMEQQVKLAEEERNPTIETATLTPKELQELANEYDPNNMTQEEYDRFICHLADKGVLSHSETYDIGLDRVILRPGHLIQGGIIRDDSPPRTLADVKGDALYWTRTTAQWCAGSSKPDRVKENALLKVSGILQKMLAQRKENL